MAFRMQGGSQVCKITHELAMKIRDMEDFTGERPLSEKRVRALKGEIKAGRSKLFDWSIAYCLSSGKWYRVNGQHSSTIFATMDSIPENCFACVTRYDCDTLEDIAVLYSTFDDKRSARTNRDIVSCVLSTLPEISDTVSQTVASLCVTGMVLYHGFLNEGEYRNSGTGREISVANSSSIEKADLLRRNVSFSVFLSKLLHGCTKTRKHIARGPVVAAIYATYLINREVCDSFWNSVGSGLTMPGDPERVIEDFLKSTRVLGDGKNSVSPREMYVKCIHAWNAYRRGRKITLFYRRDADVPVAV